MSAVPHPVSGIGPSTVTGFVVEHRLNTNKRPNEPQFNEGTVKRKAYRCKNVAEDLSVTLSVSQAAHSLYSETANGTLEHVPVRHKMCRHRCEAKRIPYCL